MLKEVAQDPHITRNLRTLFSLHLTVPRTDAHEQSWTKSYIKESSNIKRVLGFWLTTFNMIHTIASFPLLSWVLQMVKYAMFQRS